MFVEFPGAGVGIMSATQRVDGSRASEHARLPKAVGALLTRRERVSSLLPPLHNLVHPPWYVMTDISGTGKPNYKDLVSQHIRLRQHCLLPTGPPSPGRVCAGGSQARFSGGGFEVKDSCYPPRAQGTPHTYAR